MARKKKKGKARRRRAVKPAAPAAPTRRVPEWVKTLATALAVKAITAAAVYLWHVVGLSPEPAGDPTRCRRS